MTRQVSLSVAERLVLINLLPREGDFLTLATVQEITSRLEFGAAERAALGLKSENGLVSWEPEKEPPPTLYGFSDAEDKVIIDTLRQLDERHKLKSEQLDVYRAFMLPQAQKADAA